jgi:hypothetical protein
MTWQAPPCECLTRSPSTSSVRWPSSVPTSSSASPLLVVIGWIGRPFGLLWLGLPVVAAILVSQKGGRRYLDDTGRG